MSGVLGALLGSNGAAAASSGLLFFGTDTGPTLKVFDTTDAQTFTGPVRSTCILTTAKTVTPCVLYHNGVLWLVTNKTDAAGAGNQMLYLDLWRVTLSGLVCTYVGQIDFSGAIGTGASAAVWSAKFFVDPADDSVHLFAGASADQSAGTGFVIYETHPTDTTNFTTWSTPVAISGTSLPANMIDPQVLKSGSTYHMYVKDESGGGIKRLTSSSLLSGWTVADASVLAGVEAPQAFQINGTGTWYMLVDAGGGVTKVSTSSGGITGPWGTPATITAPYNLRHGTIIDKPAGYAVGTAASDFIARTNGLSGGDQAIYNTLLDGLTTDGVISLFDCIYDLAAPDNTTRLLNLINNAFSLVDSGTVTFTANTGITGNGSTGYCDTGFKPSDYDAGLKAYTNRYTRDLASFGVYIRGSRAAGANYCSIGANGASDLYPWYTDNKTYAEINANNANFTATTVAGMWIVTRTASNVVKVYLNGVLIQTFAIASSNNATVNFNLLRNPAAGSGYSADPLAFAFIGGALDATQAANVSARFNAAATSLGINVY